MEIISHRGLWINSLEKNTFQSFERCFNLDIGTETDIRDFDGDLVISHDVANKNNIKTIDFFSLYNRNDCTKTIALNIKSDGLQEKLRTQLTKYGIENYFVFDMSIPETIRYIEKGFKVFIRQSEYEKEPIFYEQIQGIWLDSFYDIWFDESLIKSHINAGKKVAIVSPDLHNREYKSFWIMLKNMDLDYDKIILCTDFPLEAKKFFNISK